MNSPQLTPKDWLNTALNELRERGHEALKAQPLAKVLKVSRGSFYHHFDNLESFHAAVISHWAERSSGQIIQTARETENPEEALEKLLQKTLRSGEALERAIRAWSTVQLKVAEAVEEVDAERIAVAEALLVRNGVPESDAKARARLLYWAAIGRLMMPFPANNTLLSTEIARIAHLMMRY